MADDSRHLEQLLAELGQIVEWPPTPDLRAGVRRRIGRRPGPNLTVLLIAAALAAALAVGLAVTAYLGLRGATISRVPALPSTPTQAQPSTSSASPAPGSAGARLQLGSAYASVADAERAAGFHLLVPAGLGQPDEVYYRADAGAATLLYHPRAGLPSTSDPEVGALVMEGRASVDRNSFGKLAGPGTTVEAVNVNGGAGFWITGAPHGFFIYSGGSGSDQFRLAGNVLIWNQAGLVVRIESPLGREPARALAGTVR